MLVMSERATAVARILRFDGSTRFGLAASRQMRDGGCDAMTLPNLSSVVT